MLATIREFGLEQLDRSPEARVIHDRHAAYLLSFATFASRHLTGIDQIAWMERIELEHANAQSALTWLESTGQIEQLIRLACAMRRFWFIRGYFEIGRSWLERAAHFALANVTLSAKLRSRRWMSSDALETRGAQPLRSIMSANARDGAGTINGPGTVIGSRLGCAVSMATLEVMPSGWKLWRHCLVARATLFRQR